MGYAVIEFDDVSPDSQFESDRRSITDVANLEHIGLSRYSAAPGDQIPLKYHYHTVQEELLYVVTGEMHVETPECEYVVETDEVFVAEPDSPHRAFNPGSADETLGVIAIGAPVVNDGHYYGRDAVDESEST